MLIKTSNKSGSIRVQRGVQPDDVNRERVHQSFQQRMQQRAAENAGLQRTQLMTREERSRVAQESMVKEHVEFYRGAGQEITETEARARVQKIAETVERKRD